MGSFVRVCFDSVLKEERTILSKLMLRQQCCSGCALHSAHQTGEGDTHRKCGGTCTQLILQC